MKLILNESLTPNPILVKLAKNSARRETFEGRDHIVVPGVLLSEMVLEGAGPGYERGPGFMPADEIEESVLFWDNIPIIVNHTPSDESARSRENLESRRVGMVLDSRFEESELKADLWFDVTKMETLNELALLEKLTDGLLIEVSTGYLADQEVKGGKHGGLDYNWIQRNLRPDHLAVLPFNKGACSISDGCGANQNMMKNILALAREPAYVGIEHLIWNDVRMEIENFVDGFYKHSGVARPDDESMVPNAIAGMPPNMKTWIAKLSLLGDPKGETLKELTFLTVVNPNTNKLNEAALEEVMEGFFFEIIPRDTIISAIGIARGLLKKAFNKNLDVNANKRKTILDGIRETIKNLTGGNSMKLNEAERQVLIDKLVENGTVLTADELAKLECNILSAMVGLIPAEPAKKVDPPPEKKIEKAPALNAADVAAALGLKPGELDKIKAHIATDEVTVNEQKESIIAKLVENGKTGMSKVELESLDVKTLTAFLNMAIVGNYSMQSGQFNAEDHKIDATPTLDTMFNKKEGE